MKLYLYLNAANALALLREARLPLRSLDHLQDPFLSRRSLQAEPPIRTVTELEIEDEIWRRHQALPEHLAELVSFDYFREQALTKHAELEAAVRARDSQVEVEFLADSQLQALCVLRLFESGSNPALWEYQADAYRGVVLALDASDANLQAPLFQNKPQLLQAVRYADERPLRKPGARFPSLFQRPAVYAGESEWRLLRPRVAADKTSERDGQILYLYRIAPSLLREMIFGCNMPAAERRQLQRFLLNDIRYRHLQLFDCKTDRYRYQVHVDPLQLDGNPDAEI